MKLSPVASMLFTSLLSAVVFARPQTSVAETPAVSPAPTASLTSMTPLAATVDEMEISLAELDRVVAAQPAFGFYKSVSGDKFDESMMNEFRWNALPELINNRILMSDIKRSVKADFAALKKEAEVALVTQMGGEEKIAEFSKAFRFSKEALVDRSFQEKVMALYREEVIAPTVTVSPAEIEDTLQSFKRDPTSEPRTQLHHILLRSNGQNEAEVLRKIEKVRERIAKGGESFEAVAKEVSECPSAPKGGDLGLVAKGMMVPEFEKAAFDLKENEMSGPVKTAFGYHLIKRGIQESNSVESQREKAAMRVRERKIQGAITARIASLKEKAKIKILLPERKQRAPMPTTSLTIKMLPPPTNGEGNPLSNLRNAVTPNK